MAVEGSKRSRDSRYPPEINYMALWGLILGLPLWIAMLVIFHLSGIEVRITFFLGSVGFIGLFFPGPSIFGGYIALLLSIAVCISSATGLVRLPRTKAWKHPGKAAIFFSIDFILLTGAWMAIFFNSILFSLRNVLDHFALSLLVMIVGILLAPFSILVLMDTFFFRLWRLFGYEDSIFNGQLYRRLKAVLRNRVFGKGVPTCEKAGLIAIILLLLTLSIFAYIGW
jgi:hypothetical protein